MNHFPIACMQSKAKICIAKPKAKNWSVSKLIVKLNVAKPKVRKIYEFITS